MITEKERKYARDYVIEKYKEKYGGDKKNVVDIKLEYYSEYPPIKWATRSTGAPEIELETSLNLEVTHGKGNFYASSDVTTGLFSSLLDYYTYRYFSFRIPNRFTPLEMEYLPDSISALKYQTTFPVDFLFPPSDGEEMKSLMHRHLFFMGVLVEDEDMILEGTSLNYLSKSLFGVIDSIHRYQSIFPKKLKRPVIQGNNNITIKQKLEFI